MVCAGLSNFTTLPFCKKPLRRRLNEVDSVQMHAGAQGRTQGDRVD